MQGSSKNKESCFHSGVEQKLAPGVSDKTFAKSSRQPNKNIVAMVNGMNCLLLLQGGENVLFAQRMKGC